MRYKNCGPPTSQAIFSDSPVVYMAFRRHVFTQAFLSHVKRQSILKSKWENTCFHVIKLRYFLVFLTFADSQILFH